MERQEFVNLLNQFVHPSEEISIPDQLHGRETALTQIRNCFETNGSHPFIWGLRGVGKTSLIHTACNKFSDSVRLAASIGCERDSSAADLINDITRRVISGGKVAVRENGLKAKLSALGFDLANVDLTSPKVIELSDNPTINFASDLLSTILTPDHQKQRQWVIVVDEFDQLKNQETIAFFTALAKQLSVDKVPVKFAFCGVAANLNDLIGSHESVDRYIKAIKLEPLPHNGIIEITRYISSQFETELNRGQEYRVSQIAAGYPHFAHVIMAETLRLAFDNSEVGSIVTSDTYRRGIQNAASGAATRLQDAYESATRKGSDKYIEILWAVANGPHLTKQFKTIRDDYWKLMSRFDRSDRETLEDEKKVRTYLNSLCTQAHGPVLVRGKVGWYSFIDPMFRSYVRMIAFSEGVDLGDESFNN